MKLYFLGVPIGRLADVSIHFLEVITQLHYLAVEDTRSAGSFLALLEKQFPKYNWQPKKLISCYRQKERQATAKILQLVQDGHKVGFMSEAGMPGISDPGNYLLTEARLKDITIEVVPGVSALTLALSLSGFDADLTVFMGFFPKKTNKLSDYLLTFKTQKFAKSFNLVFFQSPFRIRKTCQYLFEIFPNSQLFLGREMTKKFEEHLWFTKVSFGKKNLIEKGEYTGVLNIVI